MKIPVIIVVAALTFGLCYLLDKGYTNTFRSQIQHRTGLAVRLSKRYAVFGLILTLLGILAVITGIADALMLLIGGIVVLLAGVCLSIYYRTFGIFYDADSFLLTTFGNRSTTYQFGDIRTQQLYVVQGGSIVIELHLSDGRAVHIQSGMEGAYPFLDHAFAAWCRQTGRNPDAGTFHDPSNHLWFPTEEEI